LLMFLAYWMICLFRGVLSSRSIGIGNNSYILSENFVYQDILMRLRSIKRYFSKKS
jgi:hypothetical protein